MHLDIRDGDESWREVEPLHDLVYPPEILATIVWRDVTWAHAQRRVLVTEDGTLVAAVGLYFRDGRHDGEATQIGGIGGVVTHPQHRRRGFASAAMRRAAAAFAEAGVDFGLLFCEAYNIAFYAGLGWQASPGPVIVEQPGSVGPFTIMTPMARGIAAPAPARGTIDLQGLPW
jgi:aminoglycoside 2'-N-acetyltransferase I